MSIIDSVPVFGFWSSSSPLDPFIESSKFWLLVLTELNQLLNSKLLQSKLYNDFAWLLALFWAEFWKVLKLLLFRIKLLRLLAFIVFWNPEDP